MNQGGFETGIRLDIMQVSCEYHLGIVQVSVEQCML
jgi:hypothetical protein